MLSFNGFTTLFTIDFHAFTNANMIKITSGNYAI